MDNIPSKAYIGITSYTDPDGKIMPLSITWEDGRTFEIDRITDIRQAASKAGGYGIRYTCYFLGSSGICSARMKVGGLWSSLSRAVKPLKCNHSMKILLDFSNIFRSLSGISWPSYVHLAIYYLPKTPVSA